MEINYNHADANHLYGMVLMQNDIYEEALEHILRAVESNKKIWNYRNTLGELYRLMNRPPEAIAIFLSAMKLNPYNLDIQYNLGLAYVDNGDTELAITTLTDVAFPANEVKLQTVSLDAATQLCSLYRTATLFTNASECINKGLRYFSV